MVVHGVGLRNNGMSNEYCPLPHILRYFLSSKVTSHREMKGGEGDSKFCNALEGEGRGWSSKTSRELTEEMHGHKHSVKLKVGR